MESQRALGFKEAISSDVFGEGNYKLVPWISWDDWNFVRESLFSSSPDSIDVALRRISAWRSRGCLPVTIEVTASIVEIQQKDSSFRDGLSENDLLAKDMLTMLYCMTIMRLVNGIVEKTRKKNEVSIAEAADVIGIPRMLIDIRHECSHRDLPSLRLVQLASTKALDWLKCYYWEPQKMAIPYASDITASFRKEIKSKIHKLVYSFDAKQTTGSSVVKGKGIKHYEHVCGRSKFLSLMAAKIQSSKPSGSKKHINKALKNVVKLYSSFSSEVVSILLEFLLKALETADMVDLSNSSQVSSSGAYNITRLDDWKPLIMKLSNKEPEIFLSLLKALLQMIEAQEALKHNSGGECLNSGFDRREHLSCVFEWLVRNLKDLKKIKAAETGLPKSSLVDLVRKCMMVSSSVDNSKHLLTSAALVLAQKMATNKSLVEKLEKLASLLHASNHYYVDETELTLVDCESFYNLQEKSIHEASKKQVEFFKQRLKRKSTMEKKGKWSVAESWEACPIGTLPYDVVGSLGVFDVIIDDDQDKKLAHEECCSKKREATQVVVVSENFCSANKKAKQTDTCTSLEGIKGSLMIGGVWKRVTHDEFNNMASAVRILV